MTPALVRKLIDGAWRWVQEDDPGSQTFKTVKSRITAADLADVYDTDGGFGLDFPVYTPDVGEVIYAIHTLVQGDWSSAGNGVADLFIRNTSDTSADSPNPPFPTDLKSIFSAFSYPLDSTSEGQSSAFIGTAFLAPGSNGNAAPGELFPGSSGLPLIVVTSEPITAGISANDGADHGGGAGNAPFAPPDPATGIVDIYLLVGAPA